MNTFLIFALLVVLMLTGMPISISLASPSSRSCSS